MEITSNHPAGRRMAGWLSLTVFVVALFALHRLLSEYRINDIVASYRAIPGTRLLLASVLAFANYALLTGYDVLALRFARHPLPYPRTGFTAFIAFAVGNNVGFASLSGGSVRYRMYSSVGLSAVEIGSVIAFDSVTFGLGATFLLGLSLLIEAGEAATLLHTSAIFSVIAGALILATLAAWIVLNARRREPITVRGWSFRLPGLKLTLAQLALSTVDLALACAVMYALIPRPDGLSYPMFLGLYVVAVLAGAISHVPGGIGVFESVLLLLIPTMAADEFLGAAIAYRLIYYVAPLVIALALLTGWEVWSHRTQVGRAGALARSWLAYLTPQAISVTVMLAGGVLLVSGATPALDDRLRLLRHLVPLTVLEISHLAGSIAGLGLLILARGLYRRLRSAWQMTCWLLAAGAIASMLKGVDYEEATILVVVLCILWLGRDRFYRRASLLDQSFSPSWVLSIVLVLVAATWVGFFSYRHVEYTHSLWWQFAFSAGAPRMLRTMLVVAVCGALFGLWKMMRPEPPQADLPSSDAIERAMAIVVASPDTQSHLAMLGDKRLLFADEGDAFVMFQTMGRSWIAMGDPVGPPALQEALVWKFREECDRHDVFPVFYQVSAGALPTYIDVGLSLFKLGEEARVDLRSFSLDGHRRTSLRKGSRRVEREGFSFAILQPADVPDRMAELRRVSDSWLSAHRVHEKGFSLGYFDEAYLARFPVAVVLRGTRVVAFANMWEGADHEELSVDLMRYDHDAPSGAMDFLFVQIMLWGRDQGFNWFNLGMAPLSGLEEHQLAPAWHKLAGVVYRHGENFYNFDGLRRYKEKFDPVWQPRYLASPGGLALPRVLLDTASIISGGLREIVTR